MEIKNFKFQDNIEENINNETINEYYFHKAASTSSFSIDNLFTLSLKNRINKREENNFNLTNENDTINKLFTINDNEYIENTYIEDYNNNINNTLDNINYENEKRDIFKVIYPKKYPLFSHIKYKSYYYNNYDYNSPLKRTRSIKRIKRGRNSDHLRLMIKRYFFNNVILNCINGKLNNIGYKNKFRKFPQNLVSDITKKMNKIIMNMTLIEIFEKKDFCKNSHDLDNYNNNLKIVNQIKKEENLLMLKILNMKICDIFEEYINSDEFDDDINLIKKIKKFSDFDFERYIFLSKTFIKFCIE